MSKASDFAEAAGKLKIEFEATDSKEKIGTAKIHYDGRLSIQMTALLCQADALNLADWIYENYAEAEVLARKQGKLLLMPVKEIPKNVRKMKARKK